MQPQTNNKASWTILDFQVELEPISEDQEVPERCGFNRTTFFMAYSFWQLEIHIIERASRMVNLWIFPGPGIVQFLTTFVSQIVGKFPSLIHTFPITL